jgi:hypothetical protein
MGNGWDARDAKVRKVSNLLIINGFFRVLIPPFVGSNPATPAISEGLSHISRPRVALGLCHDGRDNAP